MSADMKEPRLKKTSAGSYDVSVSSDLLNPNCIPSTTGGATTTPPLPEGLDLGLPPRELAQAATQREECVIASVESFLRQHQRRAMDHAEATLPAWASSPGSLSANAAEQVSLTIAFGERIGYAEGYENALKAGLWAGIALGVAQGQAVLARSQDRDHRAFLSAFSRQEARTVARSVPYAKLCERRGEPERAARAREILRERGIA